jgi:UDP-N-acetylglucosamine acyltransferase
MTSQIHPSAYIAPGAKLGQNITVGAFAVIENKVEIGDGCQIGAHAIIQDWVRMGQDNIVHPTAVVGGLPQDLGFQPETETWVEIGDSNVFREGVTISRATQPGGATLIGSGCYLMNNAHIGHDCELGNHNILASNVALGGHVKVGKRVFFGGGAVVHQFCRIGSYAILQGLAGINKDVLPFMMVGGRPGKHYRLNLIGLHRADINGENLKTISTAIRRLRNKQPLDGLPETPELDYLRQWLAEGGKRGVLPFVDIHKGRETD